MARAVTAAELAALAAVAARLRDGGEPGPAELAAATRTACRRLAELHPGRSVELRVPPWAAVQLGGAAGSSDRGAHTRGTPPAVVETDPVTLRLADGTLRWPDAVAANLVRHSGGRSDLAGLWPLLTPPGTPTGSTQL
jgi:hypothetical protein